MHACGRGTIKIEVRLNISWHFAEMKNVSYVSNASRHLFSLKAENLMVKM